MGEKVVKLVDTAYANDALRVLDEAKTFGFETVMVVGYHADGRVCIMNSAIRSRMALIGAIEEIKHDILKRSYEDG